MLFGFGSDFRRGLPGLHAQGSSDATESSGHDSGKCSVSVARPPSRQGSVTWPSVESALSPVPLTTVTPCHPSATFSESSGEPSPARHVLRGAQA
jgi:hypothetical protein